jgi:hypothetical protein
LYKLAWLLLTTSIYSYIYYCREALGIFSHVPRLGGETHGSLKNLYLSAFLKMLTALSASAALSKAK